MMKVILPSYEHPLKVYDLKNNNYTMNTNYFTYDITNATFFEDEQYLIIESTPTMAFSIQAACRKIEDGEYEVYSMSSSCPTANIGHVLITDNDEPVYQYKRYSLDEILAQARELLNGRELTDVEKQEYHIDD